ncbi:MAG: 50S ribosomal protein L23 [Candidatus Peribacteraceae bacterium]|nr:50S ribosomal protein L23 [Candidatus Peribacteraceae bacterium]MDD5742062.1 50S ribosomal protein L23 [Candidatus Peribacteraceae bacterium]
MDFARIILGPVVTEKAERQKAADRHSYTLWVDKSATKIDVKAALEHFYDIDVDSVRVMRTLSKRRSFGSDAQTMVKRASMKKMMITLKPKSKPLDLASFKHA